MSKRNIRIGIGLWALSLSLLGCATPIHTVDRPSGPLPWTAAIGRLDADDGSCSATLISPDVILTASHCLYGRGNEAKITDFTFTPALDVGRERLKPVKVTAVIEMGWPIKSNASGSINQPPKDDWAALRIAPAITFIDPLPVEKIDVSGIAQRLQQGSKLSHAGYGVYGASSGVRLQMRDDCHLVPDANELLDALEDEKDVIVNRCEVIQGDSGGPIMLSDGNGKHSVVGVVTNFWRRKNDFVSFGPASIYFADRIKTELTAASAP